MELYKFRPLVTKIDYNRIINIIKKGFYCSDFLKFNDMNEGVFSVNNLNNEITGSNKLKYKICSFSGKNALNSELMWGHYANAGMGIAIEIDVKDCSKIYQVQYRDSAEGLDTLEKILTRKSLCWKYEDEFRFLSTTLESDEVIIGNINKIYCGNPYKRLKNYKEIRERHENLKSYLDSREKLMKFCNEKHPSIEFEDFKFHKK